LFPPIAGIRALAELGVEDKILEFKARAEAYETLLHDGTTLACFSSEDQQRRKGKKNFYNSFQHQYMLNTQADFVNRPVPRQDIRRILFEALPPDCVQWGAEFEKFEDSPDQPVKVLLSRSDQEHRI
jgi:hypothetical protein